MVCQLQSERTREKKVLSRFRKTARVGANVTTCIRLFQRLLPATDCNFGVHIAESLLVSRKFVSGICKLNLNLKKKL